MTEWFDSQTKNRYTGKFNKYAWIECFQCVVYRRRNGWAYTVRAAMVGERWLQVSTNSNEVFASEEIAKMAALASVEDLRLMVEPVEEDHAVLNM